MKGLSTLALLHFFELKKVFLAHLLNNAKQCD